MPAKSDAKPERAAVIANSRASSAAAALLGGLNESPLFGVAFPAFCARQPYAKGRQARLRAREPLATGLI